MRRASGRTVGLVFVLLLGGWGAQQADAQLVAQVPLKANSIPQFVERLPTLGAGIQVMGGANLEVSVCEFQAQVLPPDALGKRTPAPLTWVWGYRPGRQCPTAPSPTPTSVRSWSHSMEFPPR